MEDFLIRPVSAADAEPIAAIYREAVQHGTASFELTAPDATEMAERISVLTEQGYPYLVLEENGQLIGYAYVGPYRARPAYRWCVENSIYLHENSQGKGYGKILLCNLVEQCSELGFRQMIAVIGDSDNTGSIALHKSFGFEMIGTLKNVGWKHERWLDTVLMQLPLGPGAAEIADTDSLPGRMFHITKTK